MSGDRNGRRPHLEGQGQEIPECATGRDFEFNKIGKGDSSFRSGETSLALPASVNPYGVWLCFTGRYRGRRVKPVRAVAVAAGMDPVQPEASSHPICGKLVSELASDKLYESQ